MSLGRLLTTSKTLDRAVAKPLWHAKNRYVSLPKFISPRNPFAPESREEASASALAVAARTAAVAPAAASAKSPAPVKAAATVARRSPGWPQKLIARLPNPVRVARWVSNAGRKLNPLGWWKRSPKPVSSRQSPFSQPAVQTELSLEKVRVVRNALNESEGEKPLTSPLPGAAKVALVGKAMDRISSRFFGSPAD